MVNRLATTPRWRVVDTEGEARVVEEVEEEDGHAGFGMDARKLNRKIKCQIIKRIVSKKLRTFKKGKKKECEPDLVASITVGRKNNQARRATDRGMQIGPADRDRWVGFRFRRDPVRFLVPIFGIGDRAVQFQFQDPEPDRSFWKKKCLFSSNSEIFPVRSGFWDHRSGLVRFPGPSVRSDSVPKTVGPVPGSGKWGTRTTGPIFDFLGEPDRTGNRSLLATGWRRENDESTRGRREGGARMAGVQKGDRRVA